VTSKEEMEAGIAAYRGRRGMPQTVLFDSMALLLARSAGVEPGLHRWPELARELMFGPLTPTSFRMSGRDSLPDAPKRFATESQAFGCMKSGNFTPEQIAQLQALAVLVAMSHLAGSSRTSVLAGMPLPPSDVTLLTARFGG
jgi:dimethylaniline monooxygenase (N-oxide forming)